MRKLMLIIIMLIAISVAVVHASPLSMDYSIELGWVPVASFGGYEVVSYTEIQMKGYNYWNSFYTELKTKIWLWNILYIGGGITVQMHADLMSVSFDPDFTNYSFESGIDIRHINIFFSHDCTHPQMTYNEYYRVTELWGEGSINRFGIRIHN